MAAQFRAIDIEFVSDLKYLDSELIDGLGLSKACLCEHLFACLDTCLYTKPTHLIDQLDLSRARL